MNEVQIRKSVIGNEMEGERFTVRAVQRNNLICVFDVRILNK